MRTTLLPLLLLLPLLAGCVEQEGISGAPATGSGSTKQEIPSQGPAPSAAPTEEYGSLIVTVTDAELQPIPAAQVSLGDTDRSAFTDSSGVATFNELVPNKYTVLAAKPGYRSTFERGKLVDVASGEVTEVKLVLEPLTVIDQSNSYHRTLEFRGFISCSFDSRALGYTSYCGRGLTVQGITIGRDANDNSTHPWQVDTIELTALILEAKWNPSFSALGTDMLIRTGAEIGCSAYACTVGRGVGATAMGKSPLRAAAFDNATYTITSNIQKDPAKYPHTVYSEARAHCNEQCRASYGNNVLIQQRYDMYASSFYGAQPSTDWTALPK